MNVLVLNCGSSSAKFAVLDARTGDQPLAGIAQRLGSPEASLTWTYADTRNTQPLPGADHEAALRAAVGLLKARGLAETLCGVGHRVVHGGALFSGSMRVTPEVVRQIEACIPLGPLHNPPNLLGIRLAQELLPALPQVAVFDTAFHQTMPPVAYTYAVPLRWRDEHQIRRYGFHGTSHRYVARRAQALLGLRPDEGALVTAHLGNGCSATAVLEGRSVDTTMGLTPLEGLVMGTRSGSVDPALAGQVGRALGLSAERVIEALNKESGLLGLSGTSNDVRTLESQAAAGDARAQLALDVFAYGAAKQIAGLVVPLGRLDALVLTGGIGEHGAAMRARLLGHLGFLGLSVDPVANTRTVGGREGRISTGLAPQALVVPTNEELSIAQDTAEIVSAR